ncbi:L,D-transpeptidase family protein [Candidatus Pelagibacter sp.]|jgi:L,D-peptidoglycan transpeptidase YkuD (ErfK/YbiS/YcfS/YnhG family)|nr:L,D-transpeptidase family protein [Candidatus Pelagibacter sp.]
MLIYLKNKDTLIFNDFKFRCSIGKNGLSNNKVEGDKCTPKGTFKLGPLYYRKDRNFKVITKIESKIINKQMGWCDDDKSKYYNKEIKINKLIKCEKLYRKSNSYDLFLVIRYNTNKVIPSKGSAIFLHLTKNYKPTAGCIAVKKNDFLVLLKLLNKKTSIKID